MTEKVFPPPVEMTADAFERFVESYIRDEASALQDAKVEHLPKLQGTDGVYEIDVLLTFTAVGVSFKVLIECKRHKHPVKREVVQVLLDRMRSLGAQKGIICATASFQSGALEYAKSHGIALIAFSDFLPEYQTRSFQSIEVENTKSVTAWHVYLREDSSWTMQKMLNNVTLADILGSQPRART